MMNKVDRLPKEVIRKTGKAKKKGGGGRLAAEAE
jgi:hypothetical protein